MATVETQTQGKAQGESTAAPEIIQRKVAEFALNLQDDGKRERTIIYVKAVSDLVKHGINILNPAESKGS